MKATFSKLGCAFLALAAALVGNVGFAFPGGSSLTRAAGTLATAVLGAIALGVWLGRYLPESTRFQRLVLGTSLAGAEGYTSAATDDTLLGRHGVAESPLRPAGAATIDGRRVDVVSNGGYIEAGAAVEVVAVRGARIEVKAV